MARSKGTRGHMQLRVGKCGEGDYLGLGAPWELDVGPV
jgi:hypothetical protein